MSGLYETEVVSRIKNLDGKAQVRQAGTLRYNHKNYPLYYLFIPSTNPESPAVFISAGIHGDEPAGVYAALGFSENRIQGYINEFSFVIFPCINPGGFEKGTHNNPNDFNLNREFKKKKPQKEISILKQALAGEDRHYCVAIDMHEDDPRVKLDGFPKSENPNGFYMYEACPKKARIGRKIIRTIKSKGFPINSREKVYQDKNDNGLIWKEWGA
jgi:hypothetical protein